MSAEELQSALVQMNSRVEELTSSLDRAKSEAAQLRDANTRLATDNDILRMRVDRLQRELEGTRRIVLQ